VKTRINARQIASRSFIENSSYDILDSSCVPSVVKAVHRVARLVDKRLIEVQA